MRLKVLALAAVAVVAMGAGKPMPASSRLDALARDYVRMSLEAGEREPGYVDAYYGPAEWQAAAKANQRTIPALRADISKRKALDWLTETVTIVDEDGNAIAFAELAVVEDDDTETETDVDTADATTAEAHEAEATTPSEEGESE